MLALLCCFPTFPGPAGLCHGQRIRVVHLRTTTHSAFRPCSSPLLVESIWLRLQCRPCSKAENRACLGSKLHGARGGSHLCQFCDSLSHTANMGDSNKTG